MTSKAAQDDRPAAHLFGDCQSCGAFKALTAKGNVRHHKAGCWSANRDWCPGSGKPPKMGTER